MAMGLHVQRPAIEQYPVEEPSVRIPGRSALDSDGARDSWWDDLDTAVMACLKANGAMAPDEVGRRIGLSEAAAASLLCLLVMEGKVRICLVEPRIERGAVNGPGIAALGAPSTAHPSPRIVAARAGEHP